MFNIGKISTYCCHEFYVCACIYVYVCKYKSTRFGQKYKIYEESVIGFNN